MCQAPQRVGRDSQCGTEGGVRLRLLTFSLFKAFLLSALSAIPYFERYLPPLSWVCFWGQCPQRGLACLWVPPVPRSRFSFLLSTQSDTICTKILLLLPLTFFVLIISCRLKKILCTVILGNIGKEGRDVFRLPYLTGSCFSQRLFYEIPSQMNLSSS